MPFLSIEFALCFMLFLPIYWHFQRQPRTQNGLLLLASLAYLASVHWAVVLAVVWFALAISRLANIIYLQKQRQTRQKWFILGIILSLANLGFFKYFDFFRETAQNISGLQINDLLMPLGISYYTFQAIAYLTAVYRQEPILLDTRHVLLHFGFFPTITSGPIIRAGQLKSINGIEMGFAEQIQTTQTRQMIRPVLAISLIFLGIFKKWVLSGHLAENWVNPVFENPTQHDVFAVFSGVYGYTLQLYLDFSGYTDLVMGMAMLLGFQLPQNFKMPLRANSIRDFWERWHITLSTWIRDYIYIPLGGNRLGFVRTQVNVFIAMLLSGIWHGYGWNFLLWGALHGVALLWVNSSEHFLGKHYWQSIFGRRTMILWTFAFVSLTFVVFRSPSLSESGLVFKALLGQGTEWRIPSLADTLLALTTFFSLFFYPSIISLFNQCVSRMERMNVWALMLIWAMCMMLLVVLAPEGIPGFIYANF